MTVRDDLQPPPPDDPYDHRPTDPRDNADDVPHDDAAEATVLGTALLDPQHIPALAGRHTAADYWQPRHETLWRAITSLHAQEAPTDPAAVLAHLTDTDQIGTRRHLIDAPFLADLLDHAVPNATWHATRVETLARRRRAIDELTRGLQKLRTPGPDADVDHVFADTTTHLLTARDTLAGLPATTTWTPVNLDRVLAGDYLDPAPTMLTRTDGQPLIYDGGIHTISGESESGKTWLALLAVAQLLKAGDKALFLDFEDRADRVLGRLLAIGATPDQIRNQFAYVRPDRPLDDEGRAQLAPHLEDVRLVILDGVTEAMTLHGYELNANSDAANFYGHLPRWLADHGPAVAMIDHVVKDKERQDRFAIGAQHKLAGIDGAAYIVKVLRPFSRGSRGMARVTIGKDRPGHVREHAAGHVIATFSLDATASDVVLSAELLPPAAAAAGPDGAPGSFEPTVLMERISRYVQANPGMTKKAIEGAMNGKGTTIRLALELLVTRGYIGTKQGSRGAINHYHQRSYYQPDADPTTDAETSDDSPLTSSRPPEPDDPADPWPDPPNDTRRTA